MKKKFDFLLFGATGDLAMRKIFPSLYEAYLNDLLNDDFKILATGRSKLDLIEFLDKLDEKSKIHIKNSEKWNDFKNKISYESVNIDNLEDYEKLKNKLRINEDIVIYFSISPDFFITCCKNLASLGLNSKNVRIILEKPLGMNLVECKAINNEVAKYYKEEQIYRIDHYLGKSMVNELLNIRLKNDFLNAMLNKDYISAIELSVLERLGVESRGEFYDSCGALKDMLQNHMLQMLALFLMPLPKDSSEIRKNKALFFNSLNKCSDDEFIKAQYVANEDSINYLDELNVSKTSRTETFVCLKTTSNCEHLKDVPLYLRTGKRMAENRVYLTVRFKNGSFLQINIQPKYDIKFSILVDNKFQELKLDLSGIEQMPPYERLILNVINEDLSSFNEKNELEAAWEFVDNIIKNDSFKMYEYKAFTNGVELNNWEFMQ